MSEPSKAQVLRRIGQRRVRIETADGKTKKLRDEQVRDWKVAHDLGATWVEIALTSGRSHVTVIQAVNNL